MHIFEHLAHQKNCHVGKVPCMCRTILHRDLQLHYLTEKKIIEPHPLYPTTLVCLVATDGQGERACADDTLIFLSEGSWWPY
jgi:hypothetical protein